MLAEAEYFVAGQPLKIKATTPWAALDEAMEYLIQNTFNKMSYLKRLAAEPLKEIQAVLRSNDIAKETLLFQTGENNPAGHRGRAQLRRSLLEGKPAGRPARPASRSGTPCGPTAGPTTRFCCSWPGCSSWARST